MRRLDWPSRTYRSWLLRVAPLLLLVASGSWATPAQADDDAPLEVTGSVHRFTTHGPAVAGVVVQLEQAGQSVTTDDQGRFRLAVESDTAGPLHLKFESGQDVVANPEQTVASPTRGKPHTVVLCPPDQQLLWSRLYYHELLLSALRRHHHAAAEQTRAEADGGWNARKRLNERLAKLEAQRRVAEQQLPHIAQRLAERVGQDDVTHRLDVLRALTEGDTDAVLSTLTDEAIDEALKTDARTAAMGLRRRAQAHVLRYDSEAALRDYKAAWGAEPDAAAAGLGLAAYLSHLDRPGEAVTIYDALLRLESEPTPQRAEALELLGVLHAQAGRPSDAEPLWVESAAIRRDLAQAQPLNHANALARVLGRLGERYWDTGRPDLAEEAYAESAAVQRDLVAAFPRAFGAGLAATMDRLAGIYRVTARSSRAREALGEARDVRRVLADNQPLVHGPDLARTLNNLGNLARSAGLTHEAEDAYVEARSIYEQLSELLPQEYAPDLATTLNNLGVLYAAAERTQEAHSALVEARAIRMDLADENPGRYGPDLAVTLNNLGVLYRQMDQPAEAEQAYEHAREMYELLSRRQPDTYRADLARTSNNLGVLFNDVGRRAQAKRMYQDALSIQRDLVAQGHDAQRADLAMTLNNLGLLHLDMGRQTAARRALEEAVQVYEEIAPTPGSLVERNARIAQANLKRLVTQEGQSP